MIGAGVPNPRAWRPMGVMIAVIAYLAAAFSPAAAAETAPPMEPFATVNGEEISQADFETYLRGYARSKLYHGYKPEQVVALREEALEQMILDRLLAQEALRRGVEGDEAAAAARIAELKARYGESDSWPEMKERLPAVRQKLLEDSRTERLSEEIRHVADPDEASLRSFYEADPALFTEPKQTRVAVILRGVEPSASSEDWAAAEERAEALHEELRAGADFGELAQANSTHESATKGGELGFLHDGQLSAAAQQAMDATQPGQFTGPVKVLEGYVLLKVLERRAARLGEFEVVRPRALALYKREKSEAQWKRFLADLRGRANVTVGGTRYGEEQPGQGTDD
jgi:parvulin-like peptidyl-prolyl isomerase